MGLSLPQHQKIHENITHWSLGKVQHSFCAMFSFGLTNIDAKHAFCVFYNPPPLTTWILSFHVWK